LKTTLPVFVHKVELFLV